MKSLATFDFSTPHRTMAPVQSVRLPACFSHTYMGPLPPLWLPAVLPYSCLPHSLSSTSTGCLSHQTECPQSSSMPPCYTAVVSVLQQLKCWPTVRVAWVLMWLTTLCVVADTGAVSSKLMPIWRMDSMAISRTCWNNPQQYVWSFQSIRGVGYLNIYNARCLAQWHI